MESSFVDNHIGRGKVEILGEIEDVYVELVDPSNAYGQGVRHLRKSENNLVTWLPQLRQLSKSTHETFQFSLTVTFRFFGSALTRGEFHCTMMRSHFFFYGGWYE